MAVEIDQTNSWGIRLSVVISHHDPSRSRGSEYLNNGFRYERGEFLHLLSVAAKVIWLAAMRYRMQD